MSYFCNASTHNRWAPTRQNVFCSQQSIMDVILSDRDVMASEDASFSPPQMVFKQSAGRDAAEMIVVLDTGRNMSQAL